MRTSAALAALLALGTALGGLATVGADTACAHGGNFRNEGPQGPAMDTPVLPGTVRRPVTTERATWMTGNWHTWWRLHRGAFLPDRHAVRLRAEQTASSSLFGVGEVRQRTVTRWQRAIANGAEKTAVPFLLRLLDPAETHDDKLRAAALIALGRITRDAAPLALLQRYAADPGGSEELRESAVLSLGLLRRTDRALQAGPARLDSIRGFLFRLFDDKDASTRVRAFAIYALGMLADQPHRDTPVVRDGREVTRALWRRLERPYAAADLPVALLTALGMQPRQGVPTGVLEGLKAIATGKGFRGRRWDALRRSHALTAYARLDGPGWLSVALWVLRSTREHVAVRAAAAIAVTRAAGALGDDERLAAARTLHHWLPREPHWFAAGLELIALGSLLREDVQAGHLRLLEDLRVDRHLRREARDGRTLARPFAALAVGLAVHGVRPLGKARAVLIKKMRACLATGLRKGRGADDVLGAYAVGLGLADATSAHNLLLEILQDRKRGAGLRGHCAVALAQLGRDTPQVRAALHQAAEERVSPFVHTEAVRALSLLAAPETTARLTKQLETTRSRYAVAVVASALGRFGDPAASDTLVRMAGDRIEALGVRVMAVVALGLIFDPEARPTRVRMTTYANYPSRTPALTQVFNIQ